MCRPFRRYRPGGLAGRPLASREAYRLLLAVSMPQASSRSRAELQELARDRFGFADLRPGQEEVIQLILGGHDVLSIMPTGAGKSAIYQMCGLLFDGPTIV